MVAPLAILGLMGAGAALSVAASYFSGSASTVGSYSTSLVPREEYGGMSYQQYSSYLMGAGYLQGTGEQYAVQIQSNAMANAQAEREAYMAQSPYYTQAAIEKAWQLEFAERQAQYYASQAYPMEYGQAVVETPQRQLMPYKIRIK